MEKIEDNIPENDSGLNKEFDRMIKDGKAKIEDNIIILTRKLDALISFYQIIDIDAEILVLETLLMESKKNASFGCFELLPKIWEIEKRLYNNISGGNLWI